MTDVILLAYFQFIGLDVLITSLKVSKPTLLALIPLSLMSYICKEHIVRCCPVSGPHDPLSDPHNNMFIWSEAGYPEVYKCAPVTRKEDWVTHVMQFADHKGA